MEEQLYLVLPLLLLLLAKRWPRARNPTVLILAAASFAWSVWAAYEMPAGAFYLPFSRAWELLMGSLLALDIWPPFRSRWLREAAAFAGLAMIAYAAGTLNGNTPFPGVAALLPCLGSLLVLAAGRYGSSTTGRLLSLKPVVFVGLISYSVYLWHWPLIVFTKMGFLPMLPRTNRAYALSILILSLLLGTLSWQFVERPFRVGVFRRLSRLRLFGAAAAALAVSAAIALAFIAMGGIGSRFPANAIQVASLMDTPQEIQLGRCFLSTSNRFEDFSRDVCMQLDPVKKNYLLLGDSHSAALWYGLSRQMTASHILQATASGCKPNLDLSRSKDCRRLMHYVFQEFLPSHRVDALFLSARWYRQSDFENLQQTIAWCAEHKVPVVIFGPVMEYDAPLPKLLAYSIAFRDPTLVQRHTRAEIFVMDKTMRQKAEEDWHVRYISMVDVQCPKGVCLSYADTAGKVALMKDDNHLSNEGALLVIKKLLASGQLPNQSTNATNAAMTATAKQGG